MKKLLILFSIFVISGFGCKTQDSEFINDLSSDVALSGTVIYTEGIVEYSLQDSGWYEVDEATTLGQGSLLRTLSGAKAILQFDDGSILRLNENSSIELKKLDVDHFQIVNNSGELYSRVVPMDRIFEILMDDITVKSVGTAYVTINSETEKSIEVYHSAVEVSKTFAEGSDVVIEGEKMVIESGDMEIFEMTCEDRDADDFVMWNKEKDSQQFSNEMGFFDKDEYEEDESITNEEDKEESNSPVVSSALSLVSLGSGEVKWSGYSKEGYKVVWSKKSSPTYPTRSGDQYLYYSDSSRTNASVSAFDGSGEYYVRVCKYFGGKCTEYSNQVKVTLTAVEKVTETEKEEAESEAVSSISLSGSESAVNWAVDGYSKNGYKVVWSKTSSPTYPTRSTDKYLYFSSPDVHSASLTAFDGGGTYYVRVCEYLGGACGIYSNQITLNLE
ncbi:FecR family protein [Patescibacteria group bacterium]|nr:FecR family protein [Patescibacteria group bacterium]